MLASLYLRGKLKLDELIAERITLDEVNAGYAKMRTGEQARSVIMFSEF
jgi:S-(hydroxymethyl)glutathione dehydrogenase/alcohol dehydrogenase